MYKMILLVLHALIYFSFKKNVLIYRKNIYIYYRRYLQVELNDALRCYKHLCMKQCELTKVKNKQNAIIFVCIACCYRRK